MRGTCASGSPVSASATCAGSARKATVSRSTSGPWRVASRCTRLRGRRASPAQRSCGPRSTARARTRSGAEGRGDLVLGRMTARVVACPEPESAASSRPGRSTRTAASSSPGRRSSPRTASCSRSRARSGSSRAVGLARCQRDEEPAVVVVRGEEVDGHRFTMPGAGSDLELPGRSFGRPTPARRRSATVRESERLGDLATHEVGVAEPVSSNTPRPTASTRASRSQTTNPVSGAG